MSTGLLIESLQPNEGNIITEVKKDANGKSKVIMSGIFMQADVTNRNKRIYPLTEISNAVDIAANQIKTNGGIFGELDHPQTLTINMDRVSHVIKELKMVGSNAVGKAELIPTPMGEIAKVMAESGARYGISSRGTGDVGDDGMVQGFMFVTCDLVVTPSAQGAMLNPIYESLQQEAKGREVLTLAEAVREDPKAQKYLKAELLKFIEKLGK